MLREQVNPDNLQAGFWWGGPLFLVGFGVRFGFKFLLLIPRPPHTYAGS